MDIKRYIIVQAIKTKENELIPIWDERIVFEKTEMYGNIIYLKNDRWGNFYDLIECIYDLKTKQLELGVELNFYPKKDKLEFQIGESIFYEKSTRNLIEAKIDDVVYEEYDLEIERGKKIDKWWINEFKDVEFDRNTLYAIKKWKPYYILNNGVKIEWTHKLYHKSN